MCSLRILVVVTLALVGSQKTTATTDASTTTHHSTCTAYHDMISHLILKFLEDLRSHMSTGIPSMGIPPLDPLDIEDQNFRIKHPHEYDLKGGITKSKLQGLHSFNVTSISTSLLHMQANVTVTIPFLDVTGSYNLKGKALTFIPVRGQGPFSLTPSGIVVSTTSTLKLENSHVQLKSLDYSLSLSSLHANFEGLFGGGSVGNLANRLMNKFGLALFRKLEPKAHDNIRTALLNQINTLLKDIPLAGFTGESDKCASPRTTHFA